MILSGFMLGMLNRVRLQKAVLLTVSWGLYLRAWKIYQVNIIIIVSFLLLRYLPYINVYEVLILPTAFPGPVGRSIRSPQIKRRGLTLSSICRLARIRRRSSDSIFFCYCSSPLFLGMLQRVTSTLYWAPRC